MKRSVYTGYAHTQIELNKIILKKNRGIDTCNLASLFCSCFNLSEKNNYLVDSIQRPQNQKDLCVTTRPRI